MGFDCRSQCRFTLSNTHHQRRHKLKFHSCLIRQAQRAGGLADLKLSLQSGRAGGSSLPSRAELHRGLVARSVRSGKSADVSFTLDISGKRQRGRGPR